MKKLLPVIALQAPGVLLLVLVCLVDCSKANAQEKAGYFIENTESGSYLFHGTRSLIKFPESGCYEMIDEQNLSEGDKFIIIRIRDEMGNDRGVVIFDKNGKQINYDVVQQERAKHYKAYECCVYVEELKGRLYFWDMKDLDGEDYDCYMDSQTDASMYPIPHYYVFDPKTNDVETKVLTSKCTRLIKDGKINCD